MRTASPSERRRELFSLAQAQGGFFTAKQAAALDYTGSKRNYHISAFRDGLRRGLIARIEVWRAAAEPPWMPTIRALEKGRSR